MLQFPFTNAVLPLEGLPRHEDAGLSPINPRYKNVLILHFLILLFAACAAVFSLAYAIPELRRWFWWIVGAYLLVMAVRILLVLRAFTKRAFAIREHDLMYRRGILSTRLTIVPYKNVQHVSINEGFIPARYGLAQLQVYTAGNQAGALKISGLTKADALRIKAHILDRLTGREPDSSG